MSVINSFKPSKFRIDSLGPQLAYNQTYNPVNITYYQQRYCYFGSDEYLNDIIELEQQQIEDQMIALVTQQSLDMEEKSPQVTSLAEKQLSVYKKKKVFDSADYFMKQQVKKQLSIEQQQEDLLLTKYAAANLQYKPPLAKKQKKMFDSADYFLQQQKK